MSRRRVVKPHPAPAPAPAACGSTGPESLLPWQFFERRDLCWTPILQNSMSQNLGAALDSPTWAEALSPPMPEKMTAETCGDLSSGWWASWPEYDREPLLACNFTSPLPLMGGAVLPEELCAPKLASCENDSRISRHERLPQLRDKAPSTASLDAASSTGSTFSLVQTDPNETLTAFRGWSRCASPLAMDDRSNDDATVDSRPLNPLSDSKTAPDGAYACNWAGCRHANFASRDGLAWHVKAEHLFVCPVPGCVEAPFSDPRTVRSHIAVAHPEVGRHKVEDWKLLPQASTEDSKHPLCKGKEEMPSEFVANRGTPNEIHSTIQATKRRCQDQLLGAIEKKTKRNAGSPGDTDSPTELIRSHAFQPIGTVSFALVFEHAVLPFLADVLPALAGPRHVISVTRGITPQARKICVMTRIKMSRAGKVLIAGHVRDLLPGSQRTSVSFIFSVGQVSRIACWARGLDKERPDDICSPRNPYHFQNPCMGDSIGIQGCDDVRDSTATLGPCLEISGGTYWLVNFHPFLEAYQSRSSVEVEHPSPQDRRPCVNEGHDALLEQDTFKIGNVEVTSGLNLKTTRISHDPYWENCAAENPLVVTDWALINAGTSTCGANILRQFPSDTQPVAQEPLVKSMTTGGDHYSGVVPGAAVISSGRTSGHQRGQICEVPAYVSGEENGTGKATREWFVEEPPPPWDDEEAWIRGGIGVEGDSGAAVVDAETNCLVGQLWGRNKYWGSGPRLTYFTPIADIFDDIQEKCGIQTRPQLPQHRDDADRFPMYPSCRRCYDLRTYLESRRSSRATLQSMNMFVEDLDHDLTSVEAVSELATPRDIQRGTGFEEIGALFNDAASPSDMKLASGDARSPYPQSLELDTDPCPRKRLHSGLFVKSPGALLPENPSKRYKFGG
ncbi:hypothetical protein HIM_02787 [Hirsutella minnesotensis 3608]|nr:hypothetical protein HIM_02787 [Hirsutella minnesotensis 3608]